MVGERKVTVFDIFNVFTMLFVAAITLYPVLYIVPISFSETAYIVQNKVFLLPRGFNLDAYIQILSSNKIPKAYVNTILYTTVGTFINLLMTAVAAYPLSRPNFPGRKYYMIGIIITMFINGGIIPSFIIVQKLGLLDSMWALILPNAIWTFELLILKSFYESMSGSLRESAKMDGASEYRILFSIIIPLSKPALASIGLFYFMGHWNSYFLPMIYLNDQSLYPLQVVLRNMLFETAAADMQLVSQSSLLTPEAMKNATIFISMIPVLLIYPYAQRYFAKGVMLGSDKG